MMIDGGSVSMGKIITYLAVTSWCAMSYMLPIVAAMVWWRRRMDRTEIIQDHNGWNPDGTEIE